MSKKRNAAKKLSRRNFLKDSASVLGTMAASSTIGGRALAAQLCAPADGDTLVFVFLRGGADALSILAPIGEADRTRYNAMRPTLRIPGNRLIQLTNGGNLGLNPAAAALGTLYESNKLNFVMNVGCLNETTSHFSQQDNVEYGVGERRDARVRGGFLNRALAGIPDSEKSTRIPAVAVSTSLPKSLLGGERAVAFADLNANDIALNTAPLHAGKTLVERVRAMFTMSDLRAQNVDNQLRGQGQRALNAAAALDDANEAAVSLSAPLKYSGAFAPFASALKLLKVDPGLKALTIDINGWDDHSLQGAVDGAFAKRLKALSEALATFVADLEGNVDCERKTLFSRTTIVVMSEFGRRVKENSAQGTDHGRGGLAMVLGRNLPKQIINPGFSLAPASLDNGNLPASIDYRQILAEILEKRVKVKNIVLDWQESPTSTVAAVFPDLTRNYKRVLG